MKTLRDLRRLGGNAYLKAGIAGASLVPFVAHADADPFTDAMSSATTKVGTYAAAMVGLAAISVGFWIAVKYVKKITSAS